MYIIILCIFDSKISTTYSELHGDHSTVLNLTGFCTTPSGSLFDCSSYSVSLVQSLEKSLPWQTKMLDPLKEVCTCHDWDRWLLDSLVAAASLRGGGGRIVLPERRVSRHFQCRPRGVEGAVVDTSLRSLSLRPSKSLITYN